MLSNKKPRKSTGQESSLQASPWQEELPREVTELILQHLQCDSRHHSAVFRQVCRQWLSSHDSLLQTLHPNFIPPSCHLHLKFPLLRTLCLVLSVHDKNRCCPILRADKILNRISQCSNITFLRITRDPNFVASWNPFNQIPRDMISAVGAKFLASLTNLTEIQLEHVSVSQEGWVALHGLNSLISLSYTDCYQKVHRRENFLVISTKREEKAPLNLSGFRSLKNLSITMLHMTESELKQLDGLSTLTTLTSLDLWIKPHPTIHGGLRPISALKLLSSLSINSTAVTDETLRSISQHTNLTNLCLKNCSHVSGNGVAALSDLKSLKTISLRGVNVSDSGFKALSFLTALTCITLEDCVELTKAKLQQLSKLTNLVVLNLDSTDVDDEGIMAICDIKHLSTLSLSFCPEVSEVGLASLHMLDDLRHLKLYGCTNISEEGIRFFYENFPYLNIYFV